MQAAQFGNRLAHQPLAPHQRAQLDKAGLVVEPRGAGIARQPPCHPAQSPGGDVPRVRGERALEQALGGLGIALAQGVAGLVQEAQRRVVGERGKDRPGARIVSGRSGMDRFEQREMGQGGKAAAGFGGDFGGFGGVVEPGEGLDMGGGDVGVLRHARGGLAEGGGEVRLARGQLQPCEKGEAGEIVRGLLCDLLGDGAGLADIPRHLERLRLAEPQIGIARRDRQRPVEPRHRIGLSAFERDAGATMQGAGALRLDGERGIIPAPCLARVPERAFGQRPHAGIARIAAGGGRVRGQYRDGAGVLAELLERNRVVDRIFGDLRRSGAGGGEMGFGSNSIARLHRQIPRCIGQRRIMRKARPRRLGHRPRAGGIARMHRHAHPQQRFGGGGRCRGAHLLRSQPVIAIRPTGANGGT